MYSLVRPILFRFDPERAHYLSLFALKLSYRLGLANLLFEQVGGVRKEYLGLAFANSVGLAAGLDKNGDYIDALGAIGFGFIEVGTVTPRPQKGNPKPRLFRLPEHRAIINRMGFNNKGVDYLVSRVKQSSYTGVLGVNIGKNFDTPNEDAVNDYLTCLKKVYPHADYIVVNISSPNTKGLRDLQHEHALRELLDALVSCKRELDDQTGRQVPLLVKIAPDLSDDEIQSTANIIKKSGVQGIVATNTTTDRSAVAGAEHGNEAGGLSGAVLSERSREVITRLRECVGDDFFIIGVGGVMNESDALAMKEAGADLIQVYSGFVYGGPDLISCCAKALSTS